MQGVHFRGKSYYSLYCSFWGDIMENLTRTTKALLDGSSGTRHWLLKGGGDDGRLSAGRADVAVLVKAVAGTALRRGRKKLFWWADGNVVKRCCFITDGRTTWAKSICIQWVETNLSNIRIFPTDILFSLRTSVLLLPDGTTLTAFCCRMLDGLVSSHPFFSARTN